MVRTGCLGLFLPFRTKKQAERRRPVAVQELAARQVDVVMSDPLGWRGRVQVWSR